MLEKPFVGYHASVALQFAAITLGNQREREVRDALGRAKSKPGSGNAHTDRYRVLDAAEAILAARAARPRSS